MLFSQSFLKSHFAVANVQPPCLLTSNTPAPLSFILTGIRAAQMENCFPLSVTSVQAVLSTAKSISE